MNELKITTNIQDSFKESEKYYGLKTVKLTISVDENTRILDVYILSHECILTICEKYITDYEPEILVFLQEHGYKYNHLVGICYIEISE